MPLSTEDQCRYRPGDVCVATFENEKRSCNLSKGHCNGMKVYAIRHSRGAPLMFVDGPYSRCGWDIGAFSELTVVGSYAVKLNDAHEA